MSVRIGRMLSILTLLLLAASCRGSKSPLEFKIETFEKTYQGCLAQEQECTNIKFTYPVFTQAASPKGLKQVNQVVQKMLLRPVTENPVSSLENLAEGMFKEFSQFQKDFPQAVQFWEVERNIEATRVSPEYLTLDMKEYTYMGGAHPNSFTEYINLNAHDGEVLSLSDLLVSGYEAKLPSIAETAFRNHQGLSASADLDAAGYFFEGGKFKLNNNFLITGEGLKFLFNPYEVAPYVMGPIEFTVSYAAIKDLLPGNSPLKKLHGK